MSLTRNCAAIDPVVRSGRQPSARRLELTDRLARNIVGIGGTVVRYRGGRVEIGGSGFDWSKCCFGFSISGNKVTIIGGEISVGTITHVLEDKEFTINEDYQYIGAEWTLSAANYVGPSTNVQLFRPDENAMRKWFHQFRYTGPTEDGEVGSVTFHRAGVFNIAAEGNFA